MAQQIAEPFFIMTITIFGANSLVGKDLIKLALARDYTVKAFDRDVEDMIDADLRNNKFEAIKGYIFDKDEIYNSLKNSDCVVSCIGGTYNSTDRSRSLGMKNIISQMQKLEIKRIVALSGIGILNYSDDKLAMDFEEFPEEEKEVSFEHLAAYQHLKTSDLDWTLVCPSAIINNECSGKISIKENYLPTQNMSIACSSDVASFILSALEKNEYINAKVSIASE